MTHIELDQTRKDWQLDARQLAKILCVHTNKISEYLSGVTRIPCSVTMHIEALRHLPDDIRVSLFQQRLNRQAHS